MFVQILLSSLWYRNYKDIVQENRAIAGRTARYCCKFRYVLRIEFYNGIVRAVSLQQHGLLVGLCLQTAVNNLSTIKPCYRG